MSNSVSGINLEEVTDLNVVLREIVNLSKKEIALFTEKYGGLSTVNKVYNPYAETRIELTKFLIESLIINFIKTSGETSFWGLLLSRLTKVYDNSLPAPMAVGYRNNSLTLYVNSLYFTEKYTISLVEEILKHEGYHILMGHLTESRSYLEMGYSRDLLNIAMDFEINQLLNFPEDFGAISEKFIKSLLTPKALKKPLPKNAGFVKYLDILSENLIQQAFPSATSGTSPQQQKGNGTSQEEEGSSSASENSSSSLDVDGQEGEIGGNSQEGGKGTPEGETGNGEGTETGGQDGSPSNEQGNSDEGSPSTGEGKGQETPTSGETTYNEGNSAESSSASLPNGLLEDVINSSPVEYPRPTGEMRKPSDIDVWERDRADSGISDTLLSNNVRNIVQDAYEVFERDSSSGRGSMDGNFYERIQKILAPSVVPWQKLVKRVLGKIPCGKKDTINRLNRRLPYSLHKKGKIRDYANPIVVAIDTSGSVGTKDIQYFLNEVRHLTSKFNIPTTLLYIDTRVSSVEDIKETNKKLSYKVTGRGGTNFQPAWDYLKENNYPKNTTLFYFTDGGGERSIKSYGYENVHWVLTPNSELSVKTQAVTKSIFKFKNYKS